MKLPIRVLVVDDSPFIRHILSKYLEAQPGITVVGEATDGLDALAKIPLLKPNVVTLDVEMPRMDGLTALQRIMAECPTPVIMLSALTQRGARTTIQALMWGAVDFVPKPTTATNIRSVVKELSDKIKAAAGTRLSHPPTPAPPVPPQKSKLGPSPFRKGDPVIVIGASTGGPRALRQVLSDLPADLPAAVAVVQHMPPAFTRSLAQRLNESSALTVQEAAPGDRLARGLVLMAPGDFHLRFEEYKQVTLDQGPRRNHMRPAADVSMESAATHHGSAVIGVVLTGMGSDGTEGARHIKGAGGRVVAEHESTSVVYGMPRQVVEAGLADIVVPLPKVALTLIELVNHKDTQA
jgi:two-component system chemotaxis response regulator CheB